MRNHFGLLSKLGRENIRVWGFFSKQARPYIFGDTLMNIKNILKGLPAW